MDVTIVRLKHLGHHSSRARLEHRVGAGAGREMSGVEGRLHRSGGPGEEGEWLQVGARGPHLGEERGQSQAEAFRVSLAAEL